MALKLIRRDNRRLAKLVTGKGAPCAFCQREVDDEATYGKLYAIGDIQCHYFCCLLSCCLIQKGHDEEGLFGFMYPDIIAEIERCKKHRCSYCGKNGANLGCSVGVCRKQFHLPCGREKNAISLYYGTYKSYCQLHAPKQKIPDHIMSKAKLRMKADRLKQKNVKEPDKIVDKITAMDLTYDETSSVEEMVCVICYETVDGFPTIHTFWPPCCAKDAWFHRTCLQRMALSAGMHYLKCPLCNDKENFYDAVVSQGYYVPDRDAAWELEHNAFAEIYERPVICCAEECLCPSGREHDTETGKWDIKLCLLCGSAGAHAHCITDQSQKRTESVDQSTASNIQEISVDQSDASAAYTLEMSSAVDQSEINREAYLSEKTSIDQSEDSTESNDQSACIKYVCDSCMPAAPKDLNELASNIEAIIQQEQAEQNSIIRPVMPSRMSLRRTKGRSALLDTPSSSRSRRIVENELSDSNTQTSRQELNLKTPRKQNESLSRDVISNVRENDSMILSPIKLLEQSFKEKVLSKGIRDAVLEETVINTLRRKFRKPRPLCAKKRIVNAILDGIFDSLMKNEPKQKVQLEEWCSPKKSYDTIDSKDLQATSSENVTPPPNNQDKENNSNITNTPTKKSNKLDEAFRHKEENILGFTEKYFRNTRHSDSDTRDEKLTIETEAIDDANCESTNSVETIDENILEKASRESSRNCVLYDELKTAKVSGKTVSNTDHTLETSKRTSEMSKSRNFVPKAIMNIVETVSSEESKNTIDASAKITEDGDILEVKSTNLEEETNQTNKDDDIAEKLTNIQHSTKADEVKSINETEKDIAETSAINIENGNTPGSDSEIIKMDLSQDHLKENQYNSEDEFDEKKTKPKRKKMPQSKRFIKIKRKNIKHNKFLKPSANKPKPKDLKSGIICLEISDDEHNLIEENTRKKSKICTKDGDILKRLLTEKDLTSILLSELTRPNKINIETEKNGTDKIETPELAEIIETEIDAKPKTIDIQQDSSIEISENDQSINIDVIKNDITNSDAYKNLIKIPEKTKTCSFKFSPLDKETLENTDLGIDLENFKKEYLNEIDREFKCNFTHKHVENSSNESKIKTAIDFAIDATIKKELGGVCKTESRKRKMSEGGMKLVFGNVAKQRKTSESALKLSYEEKSQKDDLSKDTNETTVGNKIKLDDRRRNYKDKRIYKKNKRKSTRDEKNIEFTIDSSEKRGKDKKMKKKIKTKFAIRNENFRVKIKFKTKQVSLNIESKKAKKEKKEKHSKLKQYVLQFPEGSSKEVLVKPEKEVCPLKKKKYLKLEKTPDKMKQTSIHNFFMLKSPEN